MSSELVARLGLIAGALLVAWLVVLVLRRRSTGSSRRIDSTGLGSGIYFFSSTACPDCGSVRRQLSSAVGESGYSEMSWEQQPGLFHELGIVAVPATLIVAGDGSGVLWPGKADEALATVGP